MTMESEIKKLTEAINANTQAILTNPSSVPATSSPATSSPATSSPATPPPPPATPPPATPPPATPPTADQLQAAMVEASTKLADNGVACFKILSDHGVDGIAKLTDAQRQTAAVAVAAL